jgi:hypothetical protein
MNDNIKAGGDIHAGDGGYSIGTQEKYDEFVKGRNESLGKMRIKELAQQAEQYALDKANEPEEEDFEFSFDDDFQEKFAELIVRECARVGFEAVSNGDLVEDSILTHFGVKE